MGHTSTGKRERKRALVRKFILSHPQESAKAVAEFCQVSTALVGTIRKTLVAEGLVERYPDDQSHNRVYTKPVTGNLTPPQALTQNEAVDDLLVKGTAQMLELAAAQGYDIKTGDVTPEEMIGIYTQFMRDPQQIASVRFAAISGINKLKSEMSGRDALGPGEPLTVEDQILRLHFLLKAVGLRNSVKAFEMAFKKETPENGEKTEQITDSSGPTQDAEPSGHDNQAKESESVRPQHMDIRSGDERTERNSTSS